jgi:hypothetical protein
MAVEVVTRTAAIRGGSGTEHRSSPHVWKPRWWLREFQLVARDRVPDDQADGVVLATSGVEEDAAMAQVARLQSA